MPETGTNRPLFDTIAIVGVGLMGGSLGMAAKKNSLARRIVGIGRSEQKLVTAKILGAVDEYTLDFESGASDADLVVICTPVRTIIPVLRRMASGLQYGAIVTDVGSTKGEITAQASAVMQEGRHFVGGHPMTGSEQAGVETAFPDMYLGVTYVITPTGDTNLQALEKLTRFVEGVGARVEIMSPEDHDACAAIVSHLPHAVAAALLRLADAGQHRWGKVFQLAAGSFRDLTRVSDSPPELWRDICLTNADSLAEATTDLCELLEEFRQALAMRDAEALTKFFQEARQARQTYLRKAK